MAKKSIYPILKNVADYIVAAVSFTLASSLIILVLFLGNGYNHPNKDLPNWALQLGNGIIYFSPFLGLITCYLGKRRRVVGKSSAGVLDSTEK